MFRSSSFTILQKELYCFSKKTLPGDLVQGRHLAKLVKKLVNFPNSMKYLFFIYKWMYKKLCKNAQQMHKKEIKLFYKTCQPKFMQVVTNNLVVMKSVTLLHRTII